MSRDTSPSAILRYEGLRQQSDNHDEITRLTGLSCPPEENLTRQEFKDEADINNIVARFYPFAPPMARVPQYGEQDMSLDLHQAMLGIQAAREAYADVPPALRAQFPTYADFVRAVAAGEVEVVYQPAEPAAGSSADGSGGSASDSAPVPTPTPAA